MMMFDEGDSLSKHRRMIEPSKGLSTALPFRVLGRYRHSRVIEKESM